MDHYYQNHEKYINYKNIQDIENITKYKQILEIIIQKLKNNQRDELTDYVSKITSKNIDALKYLYVKNINQQDQNSNTISTNDMFNSESDSDSDTNSNPGKNIIQLFSESESEQDPNGSDTESVGSAKSAKSAKSVKSDETDKTDVSPKIIIDIDKIKNISNVMLYNKNTNQIHNLNNFIDRNFIY